MKNLILEAIKISKIKKLIHVGGHIGQEIEFYVSLNLDNVVFFEPIKKFADQIKNKTIDLDNFEVCQFGLGNENKNELIYIADEGGEKDNSGSSSLLQPRPSSIAFSKHEQVKIMKFKSLNFENFDCAVIDTQGYEKQVLEGFEDKISSFKFLVVEFSNYEGYIGQVVYKDLNKFLNKNNFYMIKQIKKVNRVFSNEQNGSYGDALYINKGLINARNVVFLKIKYMLVNNFISDAINKYTKKGTYKKLLKRY